MGLYSRYVFPRMCDFLLDRPHVERRRRELLTSACGNVLEIGFGTGLNLACYPPEITKITTVDPNIGMRRLAERRIVQAGIEVDQHALGGERLPFADDRFDCVVSTFTLCSIADVNRALAEVYRVLRRGGRFLFLEHGLSDETGARKWQRRLNWLQMRIGDGCHLDRNMRALVPVQPFASVMISEFEMDKTPKLFSHMYRGVATK